MNFWVVYIKDVDDNTNINDIIDLNPKKIKNFKEIHENDFSSKEYYVFLLMSSKDISFVMKKIEKIRLKV